MSNVEEGLARAAAAWTDHQSPDGTVDQQQPALFLRKRLLAMGLTHRRMVLGRRYYYNAGTKQSSWEKPKEIKDLEQVRMLMP